MTTYIDRKGLKFDLEWIEDKNYLELLMNEIDKNYIQRELISTNLNLHNCVDYKKSIKQDITFSLCKNLVLIVKHQKNIIACFIINDYFEDIFKDHRFDSSEKVSKSMNLFSIFCDELEYPFIQKIAPFKEKDILYLNILYIKDLFQGNGLSLKMIEEVGNKALELNYEYIMALATSKSIQNTLVRKFNYKCEHELRFQDFEYNGEKPFISLTKLNSCTLLVKKINPFIEQ